MGWLDGTKVHGFRGSSFCVYQTLLTIRARPHLLVSPKDKGKCHETWNSSQDPSPIVLAHIGKCCDNWSVRWMPIDILWLLGRQPLTLSDARY
jgi:hypothetical protein